MKQRIIPIPFRSIKDRMTRYWNSPLHHYHEHAANRYFAYAMMTLLTGILTFVALKCYTLLNPFNATTLAFQAIYAWETALNFGICLYIIDASCGRAKTDWLSFGHRTVCRTYLIWFGAYIFAFTVERTLIYWSIAIYNPEISALFKLVPEIRPAFWESFFYCLPFWLAIAFFLMNNALKQERRHKAQDIQQSNGSKAHQTLWKDTSQSIRLEIGKTIEYLRTSDISHISIEDHYSRIYLRNGNETREILRKISLNRLMAQLPQNRFIRIHRSYAVNIDYISHIKKTKRSHTVVLSMTHQTLPISRYRAPQILPAIERLLLQPSAESK